MQKIMAVASEGGHWKQLCRLIPFLNDYNVDFVTTNNSQKSPNGQKIYYVNDANKDKKFKLIIMFVRALYVFIKVSPSVVITTGAAPGLAMVIYAKLFNRKSIWIDSIANAEELSLSGRLAKRYATYTLSQWKNVADKEGVNYKGALIK